MVTVTLLVLKRVLLLCFWIGSLNITRTSDGCFTIWFMLSACVRRPTMIAELCHYVNLSGSVAMLSAFYWAVCHDLAHCSFSWTQVSAVSYWGWQQPPVEASNSFLHSQPDDHLWLSGKASNRETWHQTVFGPPFSQIQCSRPRYLRKQIPIIAAS